MTRQHTIVLIPVLGLLALAPPADARGLRAWLRGVVTRRGKPAATAQQRSTGTRALIEGLDARLRQNRRRRPLSQEPLDRYLHHLQRQQRAGIDRTPLLFNDADGNFQQVHMTAIILGQGLTQQREPWRVIVAPKGVLGVKPRVLVQTKVRFAASSYYEPNIPNIAMDPLGTLLGLHPAGERHHVPTHTRWVDVKSSHPIVDKIPVEQLKRGIDQAVQQATSQNPPRLESVWISQ